MFEDSTQVAGLAGRQFFARLSWTLLNFGSAHALCSGIPLANVRASLGLAVALVPRVVIDLRT